ncbi:MAG: hypothetical protein EAZ95_06670 [Bacteroidetes bacterium]|nr:MAG: hypothetical protein EAZ95_06670 [Bacteroidota bacterium]
MPLSPLQILQQFHTIDYKSDFFELYAYNPFRPPFLLQVTWNNYLVQWFRHTWHRDDQTILHEAGEAKTAVVLPIVKALQNLSLPPSFYCDRAGRDGHLFRLVVGESHTHLACQWLEVAVPDAWQNANEIAHQILSWNSTLQSDTHETYQITHQEEEDIDTKNTFWSQKMILSVKK